MARVFVTGSAQGLGRAAADALVDAGHDVVVHARDARRAAALTDLTGRGARIVIGDLADEQQIRELAAQIRELGHLDATIHNAGVYAESQRFPSSEGHPRTLMVNALAPYVLTALTEPPTRLIYLSSGLHRSGDASLADLDWVARPWNATQAYCDSKLFVTALAFAVARRWPDVRSYAVDPGWVPTRMGGPRAPDDLEEGHRTQVWLATVSYDAVGMSGAYWHHRRPQSAARAAQDPDFQDRLLGTFERITNVRLP